MITITRLMARQLAGDLPPGRHQIYLRSHLPLGFQSGARRFVYSRRAKFRRVQFHQPGALETEKFSVAGSLLADCEGRAGRAGPARIRRQEFQDRAPRAGRMAACRSQADTPWDPR